MSTKIAIISEGPIDQLILPPLISRIARDRAGISWPVNTEDVAEVLPIKKTGHGGVLEKVRAIVSFLTSAPLQYSLFVIVLDRRTEAVRQAVRRLISGRPEFVLAIAIEEIEAWWLGDRSNTLAWTGFTNSTLPGCRYSGRDAGGNSTYAAEKDDQPKKTLDELTECSNRLESRYGDGNSDLAADFAELYWKPNVHLQEIKTQCPIGFGRFDREMANAFRAVSGSSSSRRRR